MNVRDIKYLRSRAFAEIHACIQAAEGVIEVKPHQRDAAVFWNNVHQTACRELEAVFAKDHANAGVCPLDLAIHFLAEAAKSDFGNQAFLLQLLSDAKSCVQEK